MALKDLRTAITGAGGTPTANTRIGLWRELIAAWGGVPSGRDMVTLLREAVVVFGGTPSQYAIVPLIRELIVAIGSSPTSVAMDKLEQEVAALAAPAPPPVSIPVNVSAPVIGGTLREGQTLTCDPRVWTDSPTSYAYQWKRDGANIGGATSATYALVTADVGANITCAVTATNAAGTSGAVVSAAVGPVLPLAPTNSVLPVISGTTSVGSELAVDNGTWANTPTGYSYQWKRDGAPIASATAAAYTLVSADETKTITCTVTASNAGGSNAATAVGVGPISAAPALSAPTLTKTTAAGVNPPEWDSAFTGYVAWDAGTLSGDKHQLRWRRVDGGAWTTETYQELDTELLSGGFTWPLLEAAKPLAAGYFEAEERRSRWEAGVMVLESPWSSPPVIDTLNALAWSPDNYFTGTEQGAYYDVSDISTLFKDTAGAVPVTASGDAVLRINDKSGNGHHLISAAGQGPIYRTNGGAGGNKPYLDFDGVNDFFATASFASKAQPHYQAVAGKLDTTVPNCQFTDGILNGARAALIAVAGGDLYLWGGSGVDTLLNLDTADVVLAGLFNGASSKAWKDGVASAVINADTNGVTGLTMGAAYNASTWLDGRVYGLFVSFSAEPDATTKANVTTWLGNLQGRSL